MTYLCPAAPACDFVSEFEYDIDDHVVHCEGFRGVAFARPGSTLTADRRLWDLPEPEVDPEMLLTLARLDAVGDFSKNVWLPDVTRSADTASP